MIRTALACALFLAIPVAIPAFGESLPEPFDIEEASIADLRTALREARVTSVELVAGYRARIAAIDASGPMLNAVIELDPTAADVAAARDAERAAGKAIGLLHGIPILLKDNIDAVPMATSAGSLALANHRPRHDAFLVERLRREGAILLGKTNLSEWANFRSTRSTSGWSGRGGQTRNPYSLDRNPCGSSAGSGVAAAASLAAAAVGTETVGSIICPAAVNGVVGLKPTVGRISRGGVVPIAPSQDTAGPMARSVADAAWLLAAMIGTDPADPVTAANATAPAFDPARHLEGDRLRGARIGVMRKTLGYHPDVDAVFERALAAMREAGAELVDPADLATHRQWNADEFQVLLREFRPALEAYLDASQAPLRTLDELIAFNDTNAATSMRWFGQELFLQAKAADSAAQATNDAAYFEARARARRLAGAEGIDATLREHRLDALVAPATGPAWVTDPLSGDNFAGAGYGAAAVAGTPSLTVPMGDSHGMPLGIVFLGPAWSEGRLVEIGYAFEQRTKARRAPTYRRSITP
jgi:amidase